MALPIKNSQDCTYILVVSTLPSFEEANKQLAMTLKDRNPQEGQESVVEAPRIALMTRLSHVAPFYSSKL